MNISPFLQLTTVKSGYHNKIGVTTETQPHSLLLPGESLSFRMDVRNLISQREEISPCGRNDKNTQNQSVANPTKFAAEN
jgi:hypothetical protein